MQTFLYSVFDNKSGVFCKPFVSINDATAIRDFMHAATSPNTEIARFPNDFCLYRLASFQDVTGLITPEPTAINLGLASMYLQTSDVKIPFDSSIED